MGTKSNPGNYDCYAKAADDEPLFVLRAKDPTAPSLVRAWVQANRDTQPSEKLTEAINCAEAMEIWRANG